MRPFISGAAQTEVARVLASGMLVQGSMVARFEHGLAGRAGRGHAVAVSNGAAAVYLALRALGIGPGDEVLCPALTWPSPAHAIRSVGASVRLVDVDPARWNATAEAFRGALTERTRAAIAIDQFGSPCDLEGIERAMDGRPVILDAACALGSTVNGREACRRGVISCLSFHPRKVVTTGEGGACLTDDAALASRLRAGRNHGQASPGQFVAPGLNFRLTEMAAAIGVHQLDGLDEMLKKRHRIAARYREGISLAHQVCGDSAVSNEQTFGVVAGPRRDEWITALGKRGVQAGILSYSLGRLTSVASSATICPTADRLADEGLALPLFPELTASDVDRVIDAISSIQQTLGVDDP